MAIIDIDRHILTEMVILSDKLRNAAKDFRDQWESIQDVRIRTEVIVLEQRDASSPELPKLRDKIYRASKVCNTKMVVMDDAMSRQAALLQHMVSAVIKADTNKGKESNV